MLTLNLPHLVGSREEADEMVSALSEDLHEQDVTVLCRELQRASASFGDQLVKRILVDGGARRLVVVGAPRDFETYLTESATRRSVGDRLALLEAGAEARA